MIAVGVSFGSEGICRGVGNNPVPVGAPGGVRGYDLGDGTQPEIGQRRHLLGTGEHRSREGVEIRSLAQAEIADGDPASGQDAIAKGPGRPPEAVPDPRCAQADRGVPTSSGQRPPVAHPPLDAAPTRAGAGALDGSCDGPGAEVDPGAVDAGPFAEAQQELPVSASDVEHPRADPCAQQAYHPIELDTAHGNADLVGVVERFGGPEPDPFGVDVGPGKDDDFVGKRWRVDHAASVGGRVPTETRV